MNVQRNMSLMNHHKDIIRKDNCKVCEVFELLLVFCTLGLIVVGSFQEGYNAMNMVYIVFFYLSLTLYGITRTYVRNHLEYTNIMMVMVLVESYIYSFFSGIFFNLHAPSITVYALVVAACSAYLVPFIFTFIFHSVVAVIYCIVALVLKPEYGVQDTINYVFFLVMSFILTGIIYRTRIAYLKSIDDAVTQKEIALEKIELQKQLAQNRKKEETLIAGIPGGVAIYRMKKNGQVITEYVSDGLAKMCGYDKGEDFREYISTNAMINVVEEDIPKLQKAIEDSLENHTPISVRYHIHKKNNKDILNRLDANLIDSELKEDEIAVWYAVHTIVSEEAQSIIRKQQHLQELIEEVPTGIGIYEVDHGVFRQTFMNEAFYEMIGETREDRDKFLKGDPTNAIHPEDVLALNEAIKKMDEGDDSGHIIYRLKLENGGWYWVNLAATVVERRKNYIKMYVAFSDYNKIVCANQEIQNSKKTLEVALDTAKVLTWRYDYRTLQITDSSTLGICFNLPKVIENVPQAIIDMGFIHDSSKNDFYDFYQRVAEEETTSVEVKTNVISGKGTAWFHQIYTPMYDEDGNYIDSIGIAIDITEQKNREHRYEETIRLTKAARQNAVAIASYNLTQNQVTEYNSSSAELENLFHCTDADDLLKRIREEVVDSSEQEKFNAVIDCKTIIFLFQNGTTHLEIKHHLKDSSQWCQTTFDIIKNPYTGDVEAASALYDITEQVRAELVVNQLITLDYYAIMLVDANSETILPFQYSADEVALEEIINLQENSIKTILNNLREQSFYETIRMVTQNEKKEFYRIIYSFLVGEKDILLCAIQKVTDMYEKEERRKENLENALKQAEAANRAKTAFLSRVSHDMRTPLNGILGITELLKDHLSDEKGQQDLAELRLSGKYLLNLINDTLDVSRIESGKLELHPVVCDGRNVFEKSLTLMKTSVRDKNINLKIHTDNLALPTVYVDPARIDQVVMNVLGNAVKFTPEGGTIKVSIDSISFDNNVVLEQLVIEDTGIGISEEFLPRIFESFSQEDASRLNSNQGTGLGMAITKQILTVMGGDIEVESTIGVGTKVTMIVPLKCATKDQIQEYKQKQIPNLNPNLLQGKKVLLFEDNELNTTIATRVLEAKGMIVEHANDGKEGFEMFANSEIGHFDAILMDIRMPVMDGLDATRAIRGLSRDDANKIPIIAMTANAFADDIEQTRDAGMDAHLSKPIQTELLYHTLEKHIYNNY